MAIALLSIFIVACSPPGPRHDEQVVQELLRLNAGYDAAILNADAATLDQIYAPDFSFIGAQAEVRGKVEQIAHLTSGAVDLLEAQSDEIVVSTLDVDTALLTGRFRGRYQSGDRTVSFTERYTSVWTREGEIWRLRHEHSSFQPVN